MADLKQINIDCMAVIKEQLLNGDHTTWEACKIYNKLVVSGSTEHNCLGCQFVDLHRSIYDNFSILDTSNLTLEFYFKTYMFWLYQNVERIYELFDLLNPKDENKMIKTFFEKHFTKTKQIKRWTNFIKHPKAFQFTHHPNYLYETDSNNILNESIVLNSDEIESYYSGSKNNSQLYKKISKSQNVIVLIPDLISLTTDFCNEFRTFTAFICNNDIVADYLKNETTVEQYFITKDVV